MKLFSAQVRNSIKGLVQWRHSNRPRKACFIYYTKFKANALLYREAKALKEKGFDVDVICLRNSPEDKIITFCNDVRVYGIQSRPSRENSTILYFLRIGLFILKSAILMSYLALHRRYELVHVTSPPDVIVFAALVPKLLGAKIILDIHDIGPELYMRKLGVSKDKIMICCLRLLEKVSAKFSDHVITVTDLWKDMLVSRSVPHKNCTVLLNVPDHNIFKPADSNRRKVRSSLNLYYHGSFEEHFGVDTLIKAMPLIKQEILSATLYLYGAGRLCQALEEMAKGLQLDSSVKFCGTVPFFELPSVLKDADIGIVPTKNKTFSDEALSMKSLEYMALGIPIVISRTKAHSFYYDPSMVKFFEPDDHRDLARCVIELWHRPKDRRRMAANALEFMDRNGWKVYREKYYHIVEELLRSEQ